MKPAKTWAAERVAGAALFAGVVAWSYLHWVNNGGWRIALIVGLQLVVVVVAPTVAAGLFTAFRPARREWLAAGLAAALAVALVFAHRAYDVNTYDNNREVVLSSTVYAFISIFPAGSALVLAAFIAVRWPALSARDE